MKKIVLALCLAMPACASHVVYRDRTIEVKVPVAQSCAGTRPVEVTPLSQKYTDAQWNALDVRQKAAIVGQQGFARQKYGEDLRSATAACP